MEEKQQLEEQMRAVMDKYKYKRRQIRELQEDLHVSNQHGLSPCDSFDVDLSSVMCRHRPDSQWKGGGSWGGGGRGWGGGSERIRKQ